MVSALKENAFKRDHQAHYPANHNIWQNVRVHRDGQHVLELIARWWWVALEMFLDGGGRGDGL